MPSAQAHAGAIATVIVVALAGFAGLVATFWVGFIGSDDALYWAAAGGWLDHVPYVGASHWALRHTFVVPIALARRLFGDGMTAMVAPVLLYAGGAIVLIGVWVGRTFGAAAAAAALAALITMPQFVLLSSTAYVDLAEIFYLLAGLAALHHGMVRGRLGWLFCSGLLLGAALLTRETSAFAVVAIGLLFLAGFGMSRWRYVAVGAGVAIPVLGEFLALWAATGVMFYRQTIVVHHDSTIDRWVEQGAAVPLVHPLVDPVIMLLLNHNFGLLFWIGTPLAIWLLRRSAFDLPQRRFAVVTMTVATVWATIAAGMWTLLPLTPRYFLLPSVLLSIVAGIALTRLYESGRRRSSLALGGAMLLASTAGLSLDNRHFLWGERQLVAIAPGSLEIIHTSPQTFRRAELLLSWRGLLGKVTSTPPGPGDLYYDDPTRRQDRPVPPANWTALQTFAPAANLGQHLIRKLGLQSLVPPAVWQRLGPGHPPVVLYRVGRS